MVDEMQKQETEPKKKKTTKRKRGNRYLERNEEHIGMLHSMNPATRGQNASAFSVGSMSSLGDNRSRSSSKGKSRNTWSPGNMSALGGNMGSSALSLDSFAPRHVGKRIKKKPKKG